MSSIIGPSNTGPGAAVFRPAPETPTGAEAAVASGAAAPATQNPALYQSFGASVFASSALGLRTALNAEDAALILAEAALAIDEATKNASNHRIANVAEGLRAGSTQALGAMVAAGTALTANQASRAVEAGKLRTEQSRLNGLFEDAESIQTEIDGLEDQIAKASDKDKPGLQTKLDDAEKRLSETNTAISASRTEIAALTATIDELDTAIAANRTALEAAGLALLSAFSQMAVRLQGEAGARTRDAAASAGLDQRLDDLTDTLQAIRHDELARSEAETRADAAEQEAQVSRRVMQAALGLLSGLEAVLDLLRQVDTGARVDPREAALASGQRFQLAL